MTWIAAAECVECSLPANPDTNSGVQPYKFTCRQRHQAQRQWERWNSAPQDPNGQDRRQSAQGDCFDPCSSADPLALFSAMCLLSELTRLGVSLRLQPNDSLTPGTHSKPPLGRSASRCGDDFVCPSSQLNASSPLSPRAQPELDSTEPWSYAAASCSQPQRICNSEGGIQRPCTRPFVVPAIDLSARLAPLWPLVHNPAVQLSVPHHVGDVSALQRDALIGRSGELTAPENFVEHSPVQPMYVPPISQSCAERR